jgi:hypothetical protein
MRLRKSRSLTENNVLRRLDRHKAMDRARLTMGDGPRELAAHGRFQGNVKVAAYVFWSAVHGALMLELAGLLEGSSLDARSIAQPAVEALGKHFGIS